MALKEAIFNKASEYYSITYVTGATRNQVTHRYRLGQTLNSLNASIYSVSNESSIIQGKFIEKYCIFIYSYSTNTVLRWREIKSYDELVVNVEYMIK